MDQQPGQVMGRRGPASGIRRAGTVRFLFFSEWMVRGLTAGRERRGSALERVLRGLGCWLIAWLLASPAESSAQSNFTSQTYPGPGYYLAVGQIAQGEYRDALRTFNSELRGALKTTESRWIDSICHHTMMGECYLRLGIYGDALKQYDAVLGLYLTYSDWMVRVQFPPTIAASPGLTRSAAPWGSSSRPLQPGQFPNTMLVSQGRVDQTDVVRGGGVVQPAMFFRINAVEIVRCTALALMRRRELLGPLCQHDRMTAELVSAISRRPAPPNHWSEAWIDLLLGLAYSARTILRSRSNTWSGRWWWPAVTTTPWLRSACWNWGGSRWRQTITMRRRVSLRKRPTRRFATRTLWV